MSASKAISETGVRGQDLTPVSTVDFAKNEIPTATTTGKDADDVYLRANQVSQVLREILAYPPAPHWGINE